MFLKIFGWTFEILWLQSFFFSFASHCCNITKSECRIHVSILTVIFLVILNQLFVVQIIDLPHKISPTFLYTRWLQRCHARCFARTDTGLCTDMMTNHKASNGGQLNCFRKVCLICSARIIDRQI